MEREGNVGANLKLLILLGAGWMFVNFSRPAARTLPLGLAEDGVLEPCYLLDSEKNKSEP